VPLTRSRALVLQSFAYSETSKVLRLLTEDFGIRSVIARGALRPRSRFGGVLEPFTEGEAHFLLREGRDLHTLTGFDLVRSRQSLGTDLAAFAGASLVAEIVIRSGTEEPVPELFAAVTTALGRIAGAVKAPALEVEILTAVWRVVSLIGFRPSLSTCGACQRPLGAEEPARFDVDGGCSTCTRCRTSGRLVDARSRAELETVVAGASLERFSDAPLQRALVRAFLSAHLGHDRPLRSMQLLFQHLA
jgi:DNA repair protein RecO (recombination protein O)